ncbi:MAG: hypothetical protein IPK82_17305 [Polyangiaceae bacterium]|nr:hypothetical protein [Polyangiaceae bacterium]
MLKLSERIVAGDTVVFGDDQDPTTFYLFPDRIRLRSEDDGEPSFLLVTYPAEGADAEPFGREPQGLLRLRLVAEVEPGRKQRVREVLRRRLIRLAEVGRIDRTLVPEPRLCAPSWAGGRVRLHLETPGSQAIVIASDPVDEPIELGATLDVQLGVHAKEVQQALAEDRGSCRVSMTLSYPARMSASVRFFADGASIVDDLWRSARAYRIDRQANKMVRHTHDHVELSPGVLRRESAASNAEVAALVREDVIGEVVSRHLWVPDVTTGVTTFHVTEDGAEREESGEVVAPEQLAHLAHERFVKKVKETFFIGATSAGAALPADELRLRDDDGVGDALETEVWDGIVWKGHETSLALSKVVPATQRARGVYHAASTGSCYSARAGEPGFLIHVRALVVVRGEWSKAWLYLRPRGDTDASVASFSFSKKRRGAALWVRPTKFEPKDGYEYRVVWRAESGEVLEGHWRQGSASFLLVHETPRQRWTEVILRRAAQFGDELEGIRVDLECRHPTENDENFGPMSYDAIAPGTATVVPRSAWGEGIQRATFVFTGRNDDKASRVWRIRALEGAELYYRYTFIYRDGWSSTFPTGSGFAAVGADRVLRVGEPYSFSVLVLPGLRLPEDAERLDVRLVFKDPILNVQKTAHFVFDEERWGEQRWTVGSMARGPHRYDVEIVYHLSDGTHVRRSFAGCEDEALVVRTPEAMDLDNRKGE